MSRDRVTLVAYSEQWPIQFAAEASIIRSAFHPDDASVEHIGSTAIPGLDAKPIIDMLLGAGTLGAIERHIPHLEAVGYRYVPEFERQLPQRRFFVKPDRDGARFHLHAVAQGGAFWSDHLRFRDALRGDVALRTRYLELKRQLAAAHENDRAAYTDAKAPFIQGVLGRG